MKISSTLSLADFIVAYRLWSARNSSRRYNHTFTNRYFLIASIVALMIFIIFFFCWLMNLISESSLIGIIVLEIVLLLYLATGLIFRYYMVRTWFKRSYPAAHLGRNIEIDDERILFEVPGMHERKIFWRGIFAFEHEDNVALLYLNESHFLVFSTSTLTPEQLTELKDIVVRNGVKFHQAKPDATWRKILKDFWKMER